MNSWDTDQIICVQMYNTWMHTCEKYEVSTINIQINVKMREHMAAISYIHEKVP